ncbi:hypothetical protein GRJ2_002592600 [Grus japonensis]|uniref:Uncharacterized protein n=1 Tax=Grus japonensis TaxID=30415 RepID=A0ABC9XW44_GRUJA
MPTETHLCSEHEEPRKEMNKSTKEKLQKKRRLFCCSQWSLTGTGERGFTVGHGSEISPTWRWKQGHLRDLPQTPERYPLKKFLSPVARMTMVCSGSGFLPGLAASVGHLRREQNSWPGKDLKRSYV